ncbi:MAG: AAA-like domain-containing protein [Anaerolineae bacterium]
MYKFSSYGPINTKLHYHVPRTGLIDFAHTQLVGEDPVEGGHYITVWAPRQAGKTWIMQNVLWRLQKDERFDVAKINLQTLKSEPDIGNIIRYIANNLSRALKREIAIPKTLDDFEHIFTPSVLVKPLILILDEFDALHETAISHLANSLRNIYVNQRDQSSLPTEERDYLLHGVALVGVRAVLGVENISGSPFNVQHSLHIPNLTANEVESMFHWYQRESGQSVDPEVITQLFTETRGQPGLTSWLGELLTEKYNETPDQPITMTHFQRAYLWAISGLGNANILNIISKARQSPYKELVLNLFKPGEKWLFRYDDARMNFLYLNGVIDVEETATHLYARFPSPFVQKRLFNYFANDIFPEMGQLYAPFEGLDDAITGDRLHIPNLLRRYERYLQKNRDWLLKDAPRRTDLRIYEAVYHFNLYMYLARFLQSRRGQVFPEFPTGNGKIDLIIRYAGQLYGLEVKSYQDAFEYGEALKQAARYGRQLGLDEIALAFFVEAVDAASRKKYEIVYCDDETGVAVHPVFVATG